jgi:hypothetical protein
LVKTRSICRQMGLFAKGKYGKLEYRLSYNKPFATN